jgi:predicted naringenin-chalcone synthase
LIQSNPVNNTGITLKNFYSQVAFKGKKDMSWQLSSKGFLMNLTGYVPNLVKEDFKQLVELALQKNNLHIEDVNHWCIHPGGKTIVQAIEKSIGLSANKMEHSYAVLQQYGNMSSATILFVLQRLLQQLQSNEPSKQQIIFGAAFGPGLTMETFTATYA